MTDLLVALLKRLPLLALLGAVLVVFLGKVGTTGGGYLGVFAWMLFAFVPAILMAVLVARPIAEFLALPFERLYMPRGEVIPPPLYYLIEKYVQEGRLEEAMREYAKVLHYHPQEYPAHEGRIRLAVHGLRDVERARRYYQESLKVLEHPQAHADLEAVWREIFPSGGV
jgi:tetratricopeptide (TPR) repeat protein